MYWVNSVCCEVCYFTLIGSCPDIIDEDDSIKDQIKFLMEPANKEKLARFHGRRENYIQVIAITNLMPMMPGQANIGKRAIEEDKEFMQVSDA